MTTYIEAFDDGPGGWFGWIDNARGPKPLERGESCVISRSPWWIDYNHAPPGAGYMHLPCRRPPPASALDITSGQWSRPSVLPCVPFDP